MSEYEMSGSQGGNSHAGASAPAMSRGENSHSGFSSRELGMFKDIHQSPPKGIISKDFGTEGKSSFARSSHLEKSSHTNTPLIDINRPHDAPHKSDYDALDPHREITDNHEKKLTELFGEKYVIGNQHSAEKAKDIQFKEDRDKQSKDKVDSIDVKEQKQDMQEEPKEEAQLFPSVEYHINSAEKAGDSKTLGAKASSADIPGENQSKASPESTIKITTHTEQQEKEEVRTDVEKIQEVAKEKKIETQTKPTTHRETFPQQKEEAQREKETGKKQKAKTKIKEALRLLPNYKEKELELPEGAQLKSLDEKSEVLGDENIEKMVEESEDEVKPKNKDKKDKKQKNPEKKVFLQRAYFEKDVAANSARAWEVVRAFFHAKYKAMEFHLSTIEGSDVASAMRSALQEEKVASRSIKGIEKDGSVDPYMNAIASVGKVDRGKLNEAISGAEENNTASHLTTTPSKERIDAEEIEKVHNGKKVFDAWMDGEMAKVLMHSKGKQKPEFYIMRTEE